MAFNFIGIPLLVLFIFSLLGIALGIVRKNRTLRTASLILLALIIGFYIIFFVIFH